MLESLFNKVAGLKACNFINKRLQRRCFTVPLAKRLRIPVSKEHLVCLLLKMDFNLTQHITKYKNLQWEMLLLNYFPEIIDPQLFPKRTTIHATVIRLTQSIKAAN